MKIMILLTLTITAIYALEVRKEILLEVNGEVTSVRENIESNIQGKTIKVHKIETQIFEKDEYEFKFKDGISFEKEVLPNLTMYTFYDGSLTFHVYELKNGMTQDEYIEQIIGHMKRAFKNLDVLSTESREIELAKKKYVGKEIKLTIGTINHIMSYYGIAVKDLKIVLTFQRQDTEVDEKEFKSVIEMLKNSFREK